MNLVNPDFGGKLGWHEGSGVLCVLSGTRFAGHWSTNGFSQWPASILHIHQYKQQRMGANPGQEKSLSIAGLKRVRKDARKNAQGMITELGN